MRFWHLPKRIGALAVVTVLNVSCSTAIAEDGHFLDGYFRFLSFAKTALEIFFTSNAPIRPIFQQLRSSIGLSLDSAFPPLLAFP